MNAPVTTEPTLHQLLTEPFTTVDLEWKVQSCGKKNDRIWALVVPYVSARAIQSRLDEVVGPGGWRNRFEPIMKNGEIAGFLCYLALRVDGEWVEKCDGAELTDIEPIKGGISNALKRCAVQWGLGRYLYSIPTCWANVHENGKERAKTKEGDWFNWDPPSIAARPDAEERQATNDRAPGSKPSSQEAPKSPTKPADPTEEDVKKAAATLGSWDRTYALKLWDVTKTQTISERLALFTDSAKGISHFREKLGADRTDEWLNDTLRDHGWPNATADQVLQIARVFAGTDKPQLAAQGA